MIPRIDTRMYTNLILTVIALLMVAGAAREFGVEFTGTAQAQERRNVKDLERTDTGVVIDSTIPQTQDVAVAAATTEVAAANREIAAAIRELAVAFTSGMDDLGTGLSRAASGGRSSAAPAASSRPAQRPTIEVGP